MYRSMLLLTLLLSFWGPVAAQDEGQGAAQAAGLSQPQSDRPREPGFGGSGLRVGLLAGGHWPIRGEAKDAFGDVWPNLDLELFWQNRGQAEGLTADISVRWGDDDGTATLVPVTIGWWQDLADLYDEDDPKSWRSYATARFGPFYGKVRNRLTGEDESTVGLNGHLVLGALFGRRFLAELRYDWYTEVADTNFEGLTFQIGFLFGR